MPATAALPVSDLSARALADKRCTQVRVVLRRQPPDECGILRVGYFAPTRKRRNGEQYPGPETFGAWTDEGDWAMKCPYGPPGGEYYVQEAFIACTISDDTVPGPGQKRIIVEGVAGDLFYRASVTRKTRFILEVGSELKWSAATRMPAWAARFQLKVTAVRTQRLHDVTDEDAHAEGAVSRGMTQYVGKLRERFIDNWIATRGRASWESNPWCWVLTVERTD